MEEQLFSGSSGKLHAKIGGNFEQILASSTNPHSASFMHLGGSFKLLLLPRPKLLVFGVMVIWS